MVHKVPEVKQSIKKSCHSLGCVDVFLLIYPLEQIFNNPQNETQMSQTTSNVPNHNDTNLRLLYFLRNLDPLTETVSFQTGISYCYI